MFEEYKIDQINISDKDLNKLLEISKDFFQSNHQTEYSLSVNKGIECCLYNSFDNLFSSLYKNIFNNLFIFLSRTDFTQEQFGNLSQLIIDHIEVGNYLKNDGLKYFGYFLAKNGHLFSNPQLERTLELVSQKSVFLNFFDDFSINICEAIKANDPNFIISTRLIKESILTAQHKQNWRSLVPIYKVSSIEDRILLKDAFVNYLLERFDRLFYEYILAVKIIDYQEFHFFDQYVQGTPRKRVTIDKKTPMQKYHKETEFMWFLYRLHFLQIPLEDERVKSLHDQADQYFQWCINPLAFDYQYFEPDWFGKNNLEVFYQRFAHDPVLKQHLMAYLKKNTNETISRYYFQYFVE